MGGDNSRTPGCIVLWMTGFCSMFCIAGCGENNGPPEYAPITGVWQGLNLEIQVVDRPSNACEATFPYVDKHFELVMNEFDPNWSATSLPTFWWVSGPFMEALACPSDVNGCISYGQVHARTLPHEHEVVHLVTQQFGGCHVLLNEGLAELFRGPTLEAPMEGTMSELLAELTPTSLPIDFYARAGSFVDYLASEFGLVALRSVCLQAPLGSDIAALDASFVSNLGATLDSLVAGYEQDVQAEPIDYLRLPVTCASTDSVAVSTASPVDIDIDLACGEHVLGSPDTSLRFQRRIDVIDPVEYRFTFTANSFSGDSWVRIVSCEPGIDREWFWTQPEWNGDERFFSFLGAGSYVMVVAGSSDDRLSIQVEALL